jgi:hypothetical protein
MLGFCCRNWGQEDPDVEMRGESKCIGVQLLKSIAELLRAQIVKYAAGAVDEVDEKTMADSAACGLEAAGV